MSRSARPTPFALLAFAVALPACSREAPAAPAAAPASAAQAPRASAGAVAEPWPDEARERGLDYVNRSGGPEKRIILEANGAGVALLDLGRDGDLDIVCAQGLPTFGQLLTGPGADLEVFENDGSGRFARAPGPGLSGWWTGLATGDVDNDGDADLVAGGYGGLELLLQDERGALARAPAHDLMPPDADARLVPGAPRAQGAPPLWVTSLALFDADRDGNLDLYVGQYLELDPLAPPIGSVGEGVLAIPCRWKGLAVFCGPHGLVPQADRVLRGDGAGRFADVTREWTPGMVAGYTLGVAAFDADNDGDDDVYVARDSVPNVLWINDGRGRFEDHALAANVALSLDGAAQAGMGIATGDVNRDGLPDLTVTNFSGEGTQLYFGSARGFACETFRFGLARETKSLLSWGVHICDFDADGWLELFTANGHVYPQADAPDTGTRYGQAAGLWRLEPGDRARRSEPATKRSLFAPELGARGSAIGDVDGDLAPDLVLARIDGPCALGMNRSGDGHRLAVRCLGPQARASSGLRTPADGMGARVLVVPKVGRGEPFALIAETQTAQGFQSASSPWLHLGLGASAGYDALRVLWPSGRVEELGPGAPDRRITIQEGRGIVMDEAVP